VKDTYLREYARGYGSTEVTFRFRGQDFVFTLSQGLFSSADVDKGSRLLLKRLSRHLDDLSAQNKALPRTVLDAGSGTGVLGICAAKALAHLLPPGDLQVRSQDRDELARIFTEYNAQRNLPPVNPPILSAYTEALLSSPADLPWDLILSNIPAKAGKPVLEDFIPRSLGLLSPSGYVIMVAVKPLADFFRERIVRFCPLLREEEGTEHRVFIYGAGPEPGVSGVPPPNVPDLSGAASPGGDFFKSHPQYIRTRGTYELEGSAYSMEALHGAPDYDRPGFGVSAAARLFRRLSPAPDPRPMLVWEPAQGHFPAWLAAREPGPGNRTVVLAGRNVLALAAARHNTEALLGEGRVRALPAADLALDRERLLEAAGGAYGFIAAFPDDGARKDLYRAVWEGLGDLLAPGGLVLFALPSAEAERLDRKKPPGFRCLGDLKRHSFRALAYGR
jgi:16S rRNA G1207 methylase RsmC